VPRSVRPTARTWSTRQVAEPAAPLPPPARCALCDHPWAAHFGGGPTAVWVTCCATPGQPDLDEDETPPAVAGLTGPTPSCYCRRGVDEFRAEALAAAHGRAATSPPATPADSRVDDHGTAETTTGPQGAVEVLCVTCGRAPAQDTQCRPCRQARQHASRARFTAHQARVTRPAPRPPGT